MNDVAYFPISQVVFAVTLIYEIDRVSDSASVCVSRFQFN
jgi:hypothetical protein